MHRHILIFYCFLPFIAQAQNQFFGSLRAEGIGQNENQNPFWIYANKNGRIDRDTQIMSLAQLKYAGKLDSKNSFQFGSGFIVRNAKTDQFFIDELYAQFKHKKFTFKAGVWHRSIRMNDLSSVGGDIIWSGNARALPGMLIGLHENVPLSRKLSFRAQWGHYFLNSDRFVSNAQVHFKNVHFDYDLNPLDRLSFTLDHFAQFGGVSRAYGPQPSTFSDFVRIFTGWSGGSEARSTDQANALGNHLGSYTFSYKMTRYYFDLNLYHQNIFEDSSGMEFRNFPDGVWGVYLEPKGTTFIKALIYEYVQTVSQSGRFVEPPNGNFRGGDNYFGNGIYQSGWTYKGDIIGLPFIIPGDDGTGIKINRSYIHHLGLLGQLDNLVYKLKGSYVRNLGTYTKPLERSEQAFYSYLRLSHPLFSGQINTTFAMDLSNIQSTSIGMGLGYEISF